MLLAVDSDFSAALHLPSNVNFRRRIVPDQNHRESGTHPRSRHRLHLRSDFSPNFASDLVTVQNNRSHKPSFLQTFPTGNSVLPTLPTFASANSRTRSNAACNSP